MSAMTVGALLWAAVLLPAAPVLLLALSGWTARPVREHHTAATVLWSYAATALVGVALAVHVVRSGPAHAELIWFVTSHHAVTAAVGVDLVSAPLLVLFPTLVWTVALFSRRYLHAEPGFRRFYLLLSLIGAGCHLVAAAASLPTVVIGWETAGIGSALLIAFFDHRQAPARHALWTFSTYRATGVGLLAGLAVLLHEPAAGLFAADSGVMHLPAPSRPAALFVVGGALLVAAMGKSALFPLGGWLARAMEGPTPSSAVCYGALSVMLGPVLLLRTLAHWHSVWINAAVVAVGVLTLCHATLVGRVQTDAKSSIAYAAMAQIGLVVVEIGCGLTWLALAHLVAHALMRTAQLLQAPSILQHHQRAESHWGEPLPHTGAHLERLMPRSWQVLVYRHALERSHLDEVFHDRVLAPTAAVCRWLDRCDTRLGAALAGRSAPRGPVFPQGPAPGAHSVRPSPTRPERVPAS